MKPALVLGSHSVGLGLARALGAMGVPVFAVYYDEGDHGYVSKYVERAYVSPHPEEDEGDFVSFLVELADKLGGGFLIPAADSTLATVSKHKEALEEHYVVACADWETTRTLLHKEETYALAAKAGVPAPRTVTPESLEEAVAYADTVEYPCLVKPSEGHRYFEVFRQKMVMAHSRDRMLAAYTEATDAGFSVMLQEFIPGDPTEGVNYNSYSWGAGERIEFTAAKVRSAPRDTGSPCVAMSSHVPEVLESGRRMLDALGFSGYACTEFKRDPRDGVYKLMEVNARHNLSTLLAVRCGLNFPWMHYQHLVNGTTPEQREYETGIYWTDLLRDLSVAPAHLFRDGDPLRRYVQPYLQPHVDAILDRDDPKPFRKRCAYLADAATKRLISR